MKSVCGGGGGRNIEHCDFDFWGAGPPDSYVWIWEQMLPMYITKLAQEITTKLEGWGDFTPQYFHIIIIGNDMKGGLYHFQKRFCVFLLLLILA